MPMRTPVKAPGPSVTAMRSRSQNSTAARAITAAIIGTRRSAWPVVIVSLSRASRRSPSRTAAEQALPELSKARTLTAARFFVPLTPNAW